MYLCIIIIWADIKNCNAMKGEQKKNKRCPKAYLYENGVKTEFIYERKPDQLSKYGLWLEQNPYPVIEILDMRAVMK